ncbi:tRNA pseudouridine(38-40) synthase TruA [Geopsychrobacter electrodiphilus]|uniref:tRNA pseudouridine(38-40) synthase TruA n=1 Tax=Geopsychrobacter electrodiphilus TaxID=225196 RepID=UPI00036EFC15|nr:tRNA pseudouridine(38-40) synthase TruA [Geopsychrobacter electrodiphilus]
MAVIALWLEFDGGAYVGWQYQTNGQSIQQRVEEALGDLCGGPVTVYSSGRTDAGVHARGMVVHFVVDHILPLAAYLHGVNQRLPADIAVRRVRKVADRFHARFSAIGKWYRYSIYLAPVRSPLCQRFGWHFTKPLDLELMRLAARDFIGEHDFAAFRGSGCSAKTTIRRIDSVELVEDGDFVHLDVRGSGFLRHMVRMMVGTLVQIGAGKRALSDVRRLLSQGVVDETRLNAPAKGLCLQQVYYPDYLLEPEESS